MTVTGFFVCLGVIAFILLAAVVESCVEHYREKKRK